MRRLALLLLVALPALAICAPAHAIGATTTTSANGTPTSGVGSAAGAGAGAPTTTLPNLTRPLTLSGTPLAGNHTASKPHHGKRHISALAIVIAALGALLVVGSAIWGLARRRAFEPHWWLALRHSFAEAGYRTSATWAEFTDWVRLGR